MKLIRLSLISLSFIFISAGPSTTTMTPLPSTPMQAPTLNPPSTLQKKPKAQVKPSKVNQQPALEGLQVIFTSPGIATYQNGQWVGSEHLYNLSPDIGLFIEIVQSETGAKAPINEDAIIDKIVPIFKTGGLKPRPNLLVNGSPLPFLHVLLMISPIEKGFVAFCALRLFEQTDLKRIFLSTDIHWQVITWEKQELIVASTEQIQEQIYKTLTGLATTFADKFKSKQPEPK
jgi:hypothetical protein